MEPCRDPIDISQKSTVGADDESYWAQQRQKMCRDTSSIYLNCGSYAPLPKPVHEAVTDLRRRLAESPSDFHWRQTPPLLDLARTRLAAYLNCGASTLLLLSNATFGINIVAASLRLPPESEILCTDHEYLAMRYCWERAAAGSGCRIRTATLPFPTEDAATIVSAVCREIGPRTRVLFFSHVTSPTGLILPARDLCRLARERGLLVVIDGAHAPGMIPLDLADVNPDFYAGNCHKWMMAPSGAGFLYVHPDRCDQLQPIVTSWGWQFDRSNAHAPSGWGASYWARNFEYHGTADRCSQMVIPHALDFRDSIGEPAIFSRTRFLAEYARNRMRDTGHDAVSSASTELSAAMTVFDVPKLDVLRARNWLWERFHIEAPFTHVAGRYYLRVSTAWFNTTGEINQLADAIRRLPESGLIEK